MYMKIVVKGEAEIYTFCNEDRRRKPIIALNDVYITYNHSSDYYNVRSFAFRLKFTAGNY